MKTSCFFALTSLLNLSEHRRDLHTSLLNHRMAIPQTRRCSLGTWPPQLPRMTFIWRFLAMAPLFTPRFLQAKPAALFSFSTGVMQRMPCVSCRCVSFSYVTLCKSGAAVCNSDSVYVQGHQIHGSFIRISWGRASRNPNAHAPPPSQNYSYGYAQGLFLFSISMLFP